MFLEKHFKEIGALIEKYETTNINVSKQPVAWHLDHSLKVLIKVSQALKKSNPEDYHYTFNFTRSFIYVFNWIPRGKGKAPKTVRSFEVITKQDLEELYSNAKREVSNILALDKNCNFSHPYFGMLNLKQTQKFLKLHTEHHLKICRDILK